MILAVAIVVLMVVVVYPHFRGRGDLSLSVDVPYVAPGVAVGTKVTLRGAEVGEVSRLDKAATGAVRMGLVLHPGEITGLTDAFEMDFRPENYFGVTAINIVGQPGGAGLVAGRILDKIPAGDFTMSTMLEKSSLVVDGTLTDSMIASLDKIIRYTNGLDPLIQSGIVFADRVSATQRAMPTVLLGEMNQILAALPGFDRQTIDALYSIFDTGFNRRSDGSVGVDDTIMDRTNQGLNLASGSLFSAAGHLLASHATELTPVVDVVTVLSDIVPVVLDHGAVTAKLRTVIDRYNKAFTGPDNAKTLNLRIVLDNFPAVAAPLAGTGLMPPTPQEHHR
ncbi:Mce family protein [Nocardia nova]|uniref:Mce family protein n=1 Tax=Nocardia nova TaxID=37330 RepID=UPI0025AFEFFC|nr:Mce family protein [Nocardia nova]